MCVVVTEYLLVYLAACGHHKHNNEDSNGTFFVCLLVQMSNNKGKRAFVPLGNCLRPSTQ